MMRLFLQIFILLFAYLSPSTVSAQLELPELFSDHMVLQRDLPIPVWGKAKAGSRITVRFEEEEVQTIANEEGNWKLAISPKQAGGPYQMLISTEGESLSIKDILIGEVWICSGQSNMEWPLKRATKGALAIKSAQHPDIRLFHLKKKHDTYKTPYTEEELISFSAGDFFFPSRWTPSDSITAADFSAIGYFFGKKLYDSLQIPIGLIQAAVGGSPAQSWVSQKALASHPQLKPLVVQEGKKNWLDAEIIHPWLAERAKENWGEAYSANTQALAGHPFAPAYLYESAIQKLAPYAMRGVIWYQGESNATHPDSYLPMMKLLIQDWREIWEQGNFPFYFVQLPRIANRSLWPEFRNAQEKCLAIPNTAMAVSIDQGHPTDVHPREKAVIAHRLALLALSHVYGRNSPAESPVLSNWIWDKSSNQIELHFQYTYGGLSRPEGEEVKGFILQGYIDQGSRESFILPTKVQIQKDKIRISYPKEFLPTKLKYAWAPFPEVNLRNSSDLPLRPFMIEFPGNN